MLGASGNVDIYHVVIRAQVNQPGCSAYAHAVPRIDVSRQPPRFLCVHCTAPARCTRSYSSLITCTQSGQNVRKPPAHSILIHPRRRASGTTTALVSDGPIRHLTRSSQPWHTSSYHSYGIRSVSVICTVFTRPSSFQIG